MRAHILYAILLYLVQAKKVLLSVTPDLAASARTNVLFDQSPVPSEFFKAFEESSMLTVGPSAPNPVRILDGFAVLSREWLLCLLIVVVFCVMPVYSGSGRLIICHVMSNRICHRALKVRDLCWVTDKSFSDWWVVLFACLKVSFPVAVRRHETVYVFWCCMHLHRGVILHLLRWLGL